MPKIVTAGARPSRLRAGPPEERDALGPVVAESRKAAVQPGRGPDLREPRAQPGRGPDLRGDLDAEAAESRIRNRLRPGPPKDREAEDTRLQFGPIAQPLAEPSPARPESVGQRKNFQAASQEFARFLRQNSEAFAQAVEALGDSDASGFAQAWLEDYDHRAEEILNRVVPEARPLLSTDFEAHRAEYYNAAYTVERDRGILAIRQGIASTRQEYLKLVGQEPARLDYAFQKMDEMIRASGLRPDLIEEELLAARRAIFTSYRQARLAGPNPEALLREMEAGRFEGIVPPEEMAALVAQTTAEVGQRQRAALMERQVDADTRQRLELQRLQAGEGGDPHITPEKLREIFPGEVGERKARQLEEELAVAEAYDRYAAAPAEERNKALGAVGGPDSVAETAVDEAVGAEDSAERTANREAASTGPRSERDDALSEGEPTRTPDLESDSGVDLDALAQLTQEERDQVIGRERGPGFQGERPPDPVRGVAAPPDSEAANVVRRAVAKIERSLENDSKQHVLSHFPDVQNAESVADSLFAHAKAPNLAPEERIQLLGEATRQREKAISLSLERQREVKGNSRGLRIVSKSKASSLVTGINTLPVEQQAEELLSIMRNYGRYASRLLNELMQADLPDLLGSVAELSNRQSPRAQALADASKKSRTEHEKEVGKEIAWGITVRVRSHSNAILSFFRDNGRQREAEARFEAAERLAWQLFPSIGNANRAARLAVEAIFPFALLSSDLVVPTEVYPVAVFPDIRFDLKQRQENLTVEEVDISKSGIFDDDDTVADRERKARQYIDHVHGHGRWRNTCDGAQLLDGSGRPIVLNNGEFYTVTWDEIDPNAIANAFAMERPQ